MKLLYKYFSLLLVSSLLYNCANQAILQGGPKDVTPPKIDSLKSTPNFQTNFRPNQIKLYFDEYISFKNQSQVMISPPVKKNPTYSQNGKHIIVEFPKEDTLFDNTTYNINFSNTIVDLNENNPFNNFSFIFSTGDKIDSLSLKGKVLDAFDKKPEKDIFVMLYDKSEDSIVVKSRPYYFAISASDGSFKINNIKKGSYKIFALKDQNNNYLYDNINEKIGYVDSLIEIKNDSNFINIKTFVADAPMILKNKEITGFGKIKLEYTHKPKKFAIISSSLPVIFKEIYKDSVLLWTRENIDSITMVLQSDNKTDSIKLLNRKKFESPKTISNVSKKEKTLANPYNDLVFKYDAPLINIDSANISLEDTIGGVFKPKISLDTTNNRQVSIKYNWESNKKYILKLLPGAFTGLFNQKNDTLIYKFLTDKREEFGTLICNFDSLEINTDYIIKLKNGDKIISTNTINSNTDNILTFQGLEAGTYSLEIVVDSNKNGKWDGGDYFKKTQAESIFNVTLTPLKKNWEQKENINLKEYK